jgi:hypothetical protein
MYFVLLTHRQEQRYKKSEIFLRQDALQKTIGKNGENAGSAELNLTPKSAGKWTQVFHAVALRLLFTQANKRVQVKPISGGVMMRTTGCALDTH